MQNTFLCLAFINKNISMVKYFKHHFYPQGHYTDSPLITNNLKINHKNLYKTNNTLPNTKKSKKLNNILQMHK